MAMRATILGLLASSTIWVVLLIPAQRRMLQLGADHDDELQRVYRRWNVGGWLAVVPLLWSLWSMTYKPL